jgi:hypothetical protein
MIAYATIVKESKNAHAKLPCKQWRPSLHVSPKLPTCKQSGKNGPFHFMTGMGRNIAFGIYFVV